MNKKAKHFLEKIETKEDLIKMVEKIPEKNWCTNAFSEDDGSFCLLGHIGMEDDVVANKDEKAEKSVLSKLRQLMGWKTSSYSKSKIIERVGGINDGENRLYQQETPKQRSLAFLRSTK